MRVRVLVYVLSSMESNLVLKIWHFSRAIRQNFSVIYADPKIGQKGIFIKVKGQMSLTLVQKRLYKSIKCIIAKKMKNRIFLGAPFINDARGKRKYYFL